MGDLEKDKDQDVVKERFKVELMLVIEKVDGERLSTYCDYHAAYSGVDHGAMVGIEHMVLGVLNKLGQVGIEAAVLKGFGDKLKLFGIDAEHKQDAPVPDKT